MKKLIRLSPLLFYCLLMSSCQGQVQTAVPDETAVAEEGVPKVEKTPAHHDPYFNGNDLLASPAGPTTITRNILEDKTGHIWFATWEGIVRYDGNAFTNLTNREGLKRCRAFSLLEDKTGVIWIGTIGVGLYRFDPAEAQKGGTGFSNLTTKDGMVNNDVQCLYEDRAGNLWIGTRNGLSVYDGHTFRNFTKADGMPDDDINAIVERVEGEYWLGARGEACIYDGKSFATLRRDKGLNFINTRTIIQDRNGKMWLGGNEGLWSYDGQSFSDHGRDFIGNLFEDQSGKLWFSKSTPSNTYEMALYQFDAQQPSSEARQIANPNGQVFGVAEDSKGNIWFGTEEGACRYDGTTFEYFQE